MKKWQEIPLHLLFWQFSLWLLNMAFAIENVEECVINGKATTIVKMDYHFSAIIFFILLGKVFLVYGNVLFVLPQRLKDKNWKKLAAQILLLFALVFLLEYMCARVYSFFTLENHIADYIGFWKLNAIFFIGYFGISCAYVLSKNWWKNEQSRQLLVQEKLNTELSFLKSQINPHFFFNTLNNLYALSERHKNTDLSNGIAGLSNLMRYMLYDAKADYVPLEKEIAHLKSIIEVQQLRYSEDDDYTVALNIGDIKNGIKIAPLLLAPFVENAFKHGIDLHKDSFIKIDISVENDKLVFQAINSNFKKGKNDLQQQSGIGLENVKRRLQLLYPKKHNLKIDDTVGYFKIILTLHLN
ncbi:MAG TPA: hypothetical protein ENJ95_06340 [Bacteroidetes bacterium]|nr:hypothetical protein [Bacteroidota bacterium]